MSLSREVAQFGSAPISGVGGYEFKSRLPDHKIFIEIFTRYAAIVYCVITRPPLALGTSLKEMNIKDEGKIFPLLFF